MDFVETLPVELSETIFSLVSEPADFGRKIIPYISPLRLGAICRSWRYLAWSTPSLWSYIDCQSYSSCQDFQIELLEAWLSRGNEGPLAVVFRCRPEKTLQSQAEVSYDQRLFATIVRVSHRWRSIELDILDHTFYQTLNLARHKVPLLEKVRFCGPVPGSRYVTFCEGATSMTHLIFNCDSTGFITSPESFRNITSLRFGIVYAAQFRQIISQSHATLQHLCIQHLIPDLIDVPTTLDFPDLKSLVLPWTGLDIPQALALFASVPKLRKLDIRVSGRISDSKLDEFLLMSRSSLCTLRVTFNDADAGENLVGLLVRALSSETLSELCFYLYLSSSSSIAAFVPLIHEALTVFHSSDGQDSSSTPVLPHLQRYIFAETPISHHNMHKRREVSCMPILNMVQNRVKAQKSGIIKGPLKEVVVGYMWKQEIKRNARFFSDEVMDLVTVMQGNILDTEWYLE